MDLYKSSYTAEEGSVITYGNTDHDRHVLLNNPQDVDYFDIAVFLDEELENDNYHTFAGVNRKLAHMLYLEMGLERNTVRAIMWAIAKRGGLQRMSN